MNEVNILDCTLRDGGYVNQWEFGEANIKNIINKLVDANIDIIECGFLTNQSDDNINKSLFNSIDKIKQYLPLNKKGCLFVCMLNFGEYDIRYLSQNDTSTIDGIRIAFHKENINEALNLCEVVNQKGYKVFIQPMVSDTYTDEEFIHLIKRSNIIHPLAFYIVDSFGTMKRRDLMRKYYLVDNNLDESIYVGYHSHNNIQLAYSNAQALVDLKTKRKIIIDSSVFGMGRGAGNLNTELIIEYLNEICGSKYNPKPLLQVIDQVLALEYLKNYWGYSLSQYISAKHNCHPNYATYLDEKKTLTIEDIDTILGQMNASQKNIFQQGYIERLYNQYQSRNILNIDSKKYLEKVFKDKTVLLIAPGSSINDEVDKVNKAILDNDLLIISVNFNPDNFRSDYIFISNLKRYEQLTNTNNIKLITTSNINCKNMNTLVVDYVNLLNDIDVIHDNAGMMLIKLLIDLKVKKVLLAGLDGYSYYPYNNYVNKDMAYAKSSSAVNAVNDGINGLLCKFSKSISIEFVTTPQYITGRGGSPCFATY